MAYKCQVQGRESFIDSMFVVFSQAYLINQIHAFQKESNCDASNRLVLLDLGCYNGRLMHFMTQQMLFVQYTGVDVVPEYLESSLVKNRKDVTLLCEDVTKGLSVADRSQDMIVSSEVLEHIHRKDLPGVIRTLWAKLRIGGRLCISFPMNTAEKEFHDLEKEKGLGHVHIPAYEEFVSLCELTGFTLRHYDSGFTLKSSYRVPDYSNPLYKRLRNCLGTHVARAIWMTLDPNHTGGGYFTFDRQS